MRRGRRFPEEPAGEFPVPPLSFTDDDGRELVVRAVQSTDESEETPGSGRRDASDDGGTGGREPDIEAARDALVEMYVDFDPADRAQGIPPSSESRIERWIEDLFDEGINVLAWHDGTVAGHAVLVPDDGAGHELAIFVHQDYQGAGVGTDLIRALLGHGANEGVECVWLSVERWNRAGIALYEKVGFETTSAESFELEMGLRLA